MGERDARKRVEVAAATDRRESPRVPVRMMVRETALGGSFEERQGDLSVGGVYYTAPHPPGGTELEIRLLVPGGRGEVIARAEVLHVSRVRGGFGAHVRFLDLPLESELAIARYLDRTGA